MQVSKTPIAGLLVLQPHRFADARGWFSETWNRETLHSHGIDINFVQDNQSMSVAQGTIRGLHYQAPPRAQAKLVRCTRGVIYDVAVDMRPGSATKGQWYGIELSADNGLQLLIPTGFLHGFVTRCENSEIAYKCSDIYSPEHDGAVRFDDPEIGIDWGIAPDAAILSDKDRAAPLLRTWENPF